MTNGNYTAFLEKKRHSIADAGFDAKYIPEIAFDFQESIITKAVKKGRCAIYADTGLGKTLIELAIAENIIRHTNKRVLIMTPLAVAFQFILEAEKLGIGDIEYSKDGHHSKKIVVCNYERLHYFDPDDFIAVIADESSILKNCDGATRNVITAFMKKIPYRYLATATPSPNDYIELGTSSEALGHLGYTDMLTRFFANNNNNTIKTTGLARIGTEWYLKPHAETAFWQWVSQWSISLRKPSDLGFNDDRFILPALTETQRVVANEVPLIVNGQAKMFNGSAITFAELKAEVRATLNDRCEKAVECCLSHNVSFLWCNLNDEADLLENLLPNSIQIKGSDSLEKKEEGVEWFLGRKCICDSKFFGLKYKRKQGSLCGKKNTQIDAERNIKIILEREKNEKLNAELQKKIRDIWQHIINLIQKSSSSKIKTSETENAESITKQIQSIENSVNLSLWNTQEIIPIKKLNELLSLTALQLTNIIQYLKGNEESALSVETSLTELKRNLPPLTIAIQQISLEECCAPLAISDSDILKTIPNHSKTPPCICGHQSGVRRLISKPTIFGLGLNFQHCNHTTYFPTYSYEQLYQSIRRFWRFGQTREVFVDYILSDGQQRVMESLQVKKAKADDMFTNLAAHADSVYSIQAREFTKPIQMPRFLGAKI